MSGSNTLTVINPYDGKRYRLNIKGEIGRLTIGRLKQCLATASSCPILSSDQVIKFNSTPLNDNEACAAYGITNGSTLIVEHRHNVDPKTDHTASFLSPRRRALEYQTIQQQKIGLDKDTAACDETLQGKINELQDQLHAAERKKRELEREKEKAERELNRVREKEELAEKEKQRLAELQQQEARRAPQRAADPAARSEQVRAEEEAAREVALQKLDNERQRTLLEQQRAEYEAEKKRVEKERKAYERRAREREMNIRAKEIEIEQQLLGAERDRKELALQRLVSQKNRVLYYYRMGLPPPERKQAASMMEWSNGQPSSIQPAQIENQKNMNGHALPLGLNVSGSMSSSTQPQEQQQEQQYQGREKEISRNIGNDQYPAGFLGSEYKTPLNESVGNSDKRESLVPDNGMKMTGNDNSVLPQDVGLYDARENAINNMLYMSQDLGLEKPLEFDENNTCVLSVDGQYTLLVTFDTATERLYLYSAILTPIPRDTNVRLSVYEFLMEGALLGREMCGGGVGASLKNDFILLSTSIHLPTSHPTTLRTIIPLFVLSLQKWREKIQQLLHDVHAGNKPVVSGNESDVRGKLKEQSRDHSTTGTPTTASARNSNTLGADHNGSKPFIGIEATDSIVVNGVSSKYEDGVLVVSVTGPAAQAGMQPHDFITRINGRRVTSLLQFQREVSNLDSGAIVTFIVDRAGLRLVVSVKVGVAS
ncbi:Tir chaperone protein (CesT) family [Trypanosoma melophagium]|uniref:Tir chaperone protein (CesT) family n=1 Tax=Trypanosoma melophagium TaxID=715481 RepID=UPI00351A32BB|nr:Tir chaperone protein (CesT) family [Trypanosoma melophagium]